MAITKEKKEAQLSKIKTEFSAAQIVVFMEYQGLSVSDLTSFRRDLKASGATFSVYKNRLVSVAFPEHAELKTLLEGQIGYVQSEDDPSAVAKIVRNYVKEKEGICVKGGVFENRVVSVDVIESLAQLPSREVLVAKAVQLIASPISGVVLRLKTPLLKLAYVLESIKETKEK